MGVCIPETLLGPDGYFTLNQQNLETIRLVTDGSCIENHERDTCLSAFPNLKRLSWIGFSGAKDLDALADVLQERSHQLEELEIDLSRSHQMMLKDSHEEDEHRAVFADKLLRLPERKLARFSALKKLALSSVSFMAGRQGTLGQKILGCVNSVLDFGSLQSLKLQHCEDWVDLIYLLAMRDEAIRLKSLELQWSVKHEDNDSYEVVEGFLRNFQGLEELFLYTTDAPPGFWRAALHHSASLRRFVHHQRTFDDVQDEHGDIVARWIDSESLNFENPEEEGGDSLGGLDLTSLGLCCIPSLMVRRYPTMREDRA